MEQATEELEIIRQWVREVKAESPSPVHRAKPESSPEPIAITGVAGFFPGCEDVASLWRHIDQDEAMITPIPGDRFKGAEASLSGEEWGGFIPDIASFDPGAFGILPLEAEEMDPRQRLLLMSTWRTLEDAGIDPKSLRKSNTGVFVACEGNEYAVLMSRAGLVPKLGFGQANSMVANRISYHFDFAGPSEMVDATCAGFAVALHRAVVALRAGLIDRAIVGAANLILLPDSYRFLREAGQLSSGKTVKSFGRNGDGFIRAEGVGTILIEKRSDAVSAKRLIYAEIRHTAVNFNGQGGVSMASPNTEAHVRLIKACYREAGIDPREVSYIEAQGMGSPVADIAEWTAINRALGELCDEKGLRAGAGFCRVSTLKPMLGHMHSAASLGALLKVIRSFQTNKIHKVLQFSEPNEHCDMLGTPCRIATETEPWAQNAGGARLAAVHAYGSSGNNAHILLQEAVESPRSLSDQRGQDGRRVFDRQRCWFDTETPAARSQVTCERDTVLQFIRDSLGTGHAAIDPETPFMELGLDSLSLGPFVSRLEERFGIKLRKSDVFSYPTSAKLAQFVTSLSGTGESSSRKAHLRDRQETGEDDIAIVGMSLQVAGARSVDEFWSLLREGRSAISTIPAERLGEGEDAWKNAKGGWVSDIDTFDPLFFRISPKESEGMDPRHRKLLQAAWEAIEDSGHSPEEWKGANHGIFIGIEESDYPYNEHSGITSVHAGTAPARIGYFLDTKGPVLAISTACSSSLVAVHYACRSILEGESDCALAGGCNLISQPARSFFALSRMGDMLSPDGTCYAFDRRANGMVLGEGVGVVVLKRLSHALRDRDPIHAVIKASGINYDGRTNGLTAPNGARQRELYQRVYQQCGIGPAQIGYVVAHGTGTSLGDPVEVNALIDTFGPAPGGAPWCALTSPKTNIGHAQAASGIVNLITGALALKRGEIPPSLNFSEANEDINLQTGPFFVNTTSLPWTAPERYAAVSSFGHTGTNAHVVLGAAHEVSNESETAKPAGPALVVLSARSEEQLEQAARRLIDCPISGLQNLAYTLQMGRAPMEERLAFVAEHVEEIRERLRGYLEGHHDLANVFRGRAQQGEGMAGLLSSDAAMRELIAEWLDHGRYCEALKLWVNGAAIDWSRLHRQGKPKRLRLPTYPFAKERYWLQHPHPDAAPRQGVSESNQPPWEMQVMTFHEEWVNASPLPSSTSIGGTLVFVQAGQDHRMHDELRHLAPKAHWHFIVGMEGETHEVWLRKFGPAKEALDTLVYLLPFNGGDTLRAPSSLLPLLRALSDAQIEPRRLILACPYGNGLERCYVDAWVAYEPSLRAVFPRTQVAVIGLCREGVGASEFAQRFAPLLWAEMNSNGRSALYENGQRYVRRIEPTAPSPSACPLAPTGIYLITGGCGGLGLVVAEYLAKAYAAKLILTGRSALDERKATMLDHLRRLGGEAIYVQADVGDALAMTAAVEQAKERFGPIMGVIHAAGAEGTGRVVEKDAGAFDAVLHPKVEGALVLDAVLSGEPLEFVAYFSSSAAVLGDFGACDYSIANRFLSAYARHRNHLRQRGERQGGTVVINWPVWNVRGMGHAEDERTKFYLATSGQRALEIAEGLALFENLLGQLPATHLVLAGRPERVRKFLDLEMSGDLPEAERIELQSPTRELGGMDLAERVAGDLKKDIHALLQIPVAKLRPETNLADFGFDSITLAEFAERLSSRYGLKITPAIFFGHSTIARLARHFTSEWRMELERFYAQERFVAPIKQVTADHSRASGEVTRTGEVERALDEPIAVIGMSGRFPQARSIQEMWQILEEGRNALEEVSPERLGWRDFMLRTGPGEDEARKKWMGCLPGVAEFDPLFFEISPDEAETMDPRQRHLLQESWKALEDAGYGPRHLARYKVGVFVGVEEGDYAMVAPEGGLTANHGAILASRLAYFLDFSGPAMAINTACSSSLVAAHVACASLRNRECDTALVAGVSLQLTPAGHLAMEKAGMLSNDGKCHVFDKKANGMVPGEAVVAIVLKRLSQAEADGDPIHAVIRASGVNYDGKTNGITAPNGVAQAALLREVYERAKLDPGAIDYIVTHGTGTRLGDPVEINALYSVFREASRECGFCALTSTKSNFGHTFAASGLFSAVSLVEAFRHGRIPASLHCEDENDYILWEDSPFYVNKETKPWPRRAGGRRMGAVSAFGMSGTNAHMVLEEYVASPSSPAHDAPCRLLALSAKTEEALRHQMHGLAEALGTGGFREEVLAGISYTLLQGRHHFQHRFAVVVCNLDEARAALRAVIAGESPEESWRGCVPENFRGHKAFSEQAATLLSRSTSLKGAPECYRENLRALADLYCQGYDFSWQPLFGEDSIRRVSLPTYPFARESYWAPSAGEGEHVDSGAAKLHPMLHANASDLGGQRFVSRFSGNEFFLADHQIQGQRILPGVAYLEMARAALEFSLPEDEREGVIVLSNVVWVVPLVVGDASAEVRLCVNEEEQQLVFEVHARSEGNDWVKHAIGKAAYRPALQRNAMDLAALRNRMAEGELDPSSCYASFLSAGVSYGAAFRGLDELRLGRNEVLARITLNETARRSASHYVLHPSLMDAAFQATLGLKISDARNAAPRIPFALDDLRVLGPLPEEIWVWARCAPSEVAESAVSKFDLDLMCGQGTVCVEIRGLATRTLGGGAGREEAPRRFARILTGEEFFLSDHGGLLPGVVSLEWARAAGRLVLGRAVRGLRQVVWKQPLVLDGKQRQVEVSLTRAGDACAYAVAAGDLVHAQGFIIGDEGAGKGGSLLDVASIQSRCDQSLPVQEHENLIGTRLGPGMRSLRTLYHNGSEALATLELPESVKDSADDFILHPSLLNGALQAANLLARIKDPDGGIPTPFGIDELWIHRPIPSEVLVHVTEVAPSHRSSAAGTRVRRFGIALADRDGDPVVSIQGYAAVGASVADPGETALFACVDWREEEAPGSTPSDTEAPAFVLLEEEEGLAEVLRAAWPAAEIHRAPPRSASRAEDVMARFEWIFRVIQSGLKDGSAIRRPVCVLVENDGDQGLASACAALARSARQEQARLDVKVIRHHSRWSEEREQFVALLKSEIGHVTLDPEVRLRAAGKRDVRTIGEIQLPALGGSDAKRADEVIWITGGMGGLGRVFAAHFALKRGARVFLSGRSPLDVEGNRFLEQMRTQGGKVYYLQGDVSNSEEVRRILDSIREQVGRLSGILHSAGAIEDAYIQAKDPAAIARVWAAKVEGALILDEETRDIDLEFMVFFSSLSGAFGNAGQSDYAGANAFLDAFALERNEKVAAGQRRGRTVSMAWPLWRDGGMGMDEQSEILLKQRSGMTPMGAAQGVDALLRTLQSDHGHVLVLHGDAGKIREKLLARSAHEPAAQEVRTGGASGGLSLEEMQEALRDLVAGQQKLTREKISLDGELPRYGFDSIRLTDLANRVNAAFGLDVMPTLFFEFTTVRAIARHLVDKYPGVSVAGRKRQSIPAPAMLSQRARRSPRRRSGQSEHAGSPEGQASAPAIAIVGISGRFPGSVNVDEFWKHLEANHDLISEVPESRWPWRDYYGDPSEEPGKTKVTHAGFMSGVDEFDPAFFGISPREAISMDPQARLLLENVWATIEDAGYRASDLAGSKTGVFVGVSTSDYKDAWLRQAGAAGSVNGPPLVSHFALANRISYALDLRGPSEPIDTACSSSLIAIHRAIEAIRQGNCEQALVGGVNVISAPDITIGASRAGMLSEDGRCKTFDESADGYGRGEGVGALLIKPLHRALEDGDHIYALIRGSAENHGGKAQSPAAPNPAAQRDLLVTAYSRAGVDPRTIGYIEAHGTGTSLGDPIEIEGLSGAFAELYKSAGLKVDEPHCGLGSVKTNVGHLEAAAGIAGILKVVMMLRHHKIPGNAHLHQPNKYLRLEGTPFYLARTTQDWKAPVDGNQQALPRRAGVSSFGIGGSNAHVILEEYMPEDAAEDTSADGRDATLVIVLSARDGDRLKETADNLLAFLTSGTCRAPALRDLAYTLQVGREPLDERVAFAVRTMEELVAKLHCLVEGRGNAAGVVRGRRSRKEAIEVETGKDLELWRRGERLDQLMDLWVRGGDFDWKLLYASARPLRVSLPTYPFERKRYWFAEEPPRVPALRREMDTTSKEVPASPPPGGESVQDWLVRSLAEILLIEEDELDLEEPFTGLGLDSVIGVEWVQVINKRFGLKVPTTKVYDHPNVPAFTRYIEEEIRKRGGAEQRSKVGKARPEALSMDEILELVRNRMLDIEEANQLIDGLMDEEERGGES